MTKNIEEISSIVLDWKDLNNKITSNLRIVQSQTTKLNHEIEKYNMWFKYTYLPKLKGDTEGDEKATVADMKNEIKQRN